MLADGIVEPGGRIAVIKSFGFSELALGQNVALLVEESFVVVSLTQVAAQQGIVAVQRDRVHEVAATLGQRAAPNVRETHAESGHRIGLIPFDGLIKCCLRLFQVNARQSGKTQHRLSARQIGILCCRAICRPP